MPTGDPRPGHTCPTCGGPTCPHCGKSLRAAAPTIELVPGTTYPPPYECEPYVGDVIPNPYVVTCGTWAGATTLRSCLRTEE